MISDQTSASAHMTLKALVTACMLMLFWWCPACPSSASESPDVKVLYINSYHRGYSWSDGIEEGLRERLNRSGKNIELSLEYLDSRRFAYGKQIEPMAQAMEIKYKNYKPDVVVVSDNAAFDFIKQYRDRLCPNAPIVFCGYNDFRPGVIQGMANITGVNEEISIEETVAMALKVHPGTRTLAFIMSTGDLSSKRIVEAAEESILPKLRERFNVVVLLDASLDEIKEGLARLPRETILFFSGQTRDIASGRELSPIENGRLIASFSPFPAYTFWDFHLNTGVLGGHVLTGQDQGRAAADMVLRILAGTPADSIPVLMTSPATNIFDYNVMNRFGISPGDLPLNSVIINQPFSLWKLYRWQIIALFAFIVAESMLVVYLLKVVRDRRSAHATLEEERSSLEKHVHQRTEELREANQQLSLLSFHDCLTNIANRRRFDGVLSAELLRRKRSGKPLSLIMLDIDFFKQYNDTYGHIAGDDCLRKIAGLLVDKSNRTTDLTARYGGEEFSIILPETSAYGAQVIAERIRKGVKDLAIPHSSSSISDHVTVSLGVVTISEAKPVSPKELIFLADELLYEAKSGGRDRVVAKEYAEKQP
ncbi:MAG: diguanylate cyclase [Desulfovibrio sp.]|nr:diguanylate cyclase [Desulfovibrio sp.]MBI4960537.1 diguanylate cyclase [Desulfovibrio sp.]